jgi:hypothetical protein
MLCISRITDDTYSQNFGNNHNKFYIELRCNIPCSPGSDTCTKCSSKSDTCKVQHSRKFNHGKITEPIPDNSHIYGGKWYKDCVKKYGEPSSDSIQFAEQYQRDARANLQNTIIQPEPEPQPISTPEQIPKKTRKPKVANDTIDLPSQPIKRGRKPKVAPSNEPEIIDTYETTTIAPKPRKKTENTPYSSLVSTKSQLVHKEVSLPTHLENKLEEIDIDGFQIEYIKLSPFEHNGTTYFRDHNKNKLYKKIKDKVGQYVGRFNSENDSVVTDVPDSDDEN